MKRGLDLYNRIDGATLMQSCLVYEVLLLLLLHRKMKCVDHNCLEIESSCLDRNAEREETTSGDK